MLKLNKSQQSIISALINGQSKTRKGLCQDTSLSWAGVAKTINQLIKLGLIAEAGYKPNSSVGRKPIYYNLSENTYIAGISINKKRIEVALLSLNQKQIAYESVILMQGEDPVPLSAKLLRKILKKQKSKRLISVGIAFPGTIEKNKKYIDASNHFPEFEDRPIGEEIKLSLGMDIPFFVERSVDCDLNYLLISKIFEKNTIVLSLKTGVIAGIILDGNLIYSNFGTIGNFGHMISGEGNNACICGKTGCLETEFGDLAWDRQYAKITSGDFFEAVNEKKPEAINLIKSSLNSLFPTLGEMLRLIAPKILAFATSLPPSTSLLIANKIKQELEKMHVRQIPEICILDRNSTVHGAAFICLSWLSGNKHYQNIGN